MEAQAAAHDVAISVEDVYKKYSKSLRHSMRYGLADVARNALGMRARSGVLRESEFWAVEGANLRVRRGEALGLIGPNGSGKTTLLKMINGIFWPDRGKLSVAGRVGALIAVGAGFHPLLTGRENVYINAAIMGMSRREVNERLDAIIDFAEVGDFIDSPVKSYSSGMFVRLGFAVVVHSQPDVMLVDEVLAVGDHGFQTKCFKKMAELRERGTTFIVVSHNMHTIAGFVDSVAMLRKGRLERYDNVFEGIRSYSGLSRDEDEDIERLVSSGTSISFTDVEIPSRTLEPGGSFEATLRYRCQHDYDDVEVDVAIYDDRDHALYHQATNHAYGTRVDLHKGTRQLTVRVENIQINGSMGRIVLAVWARGRSEQLFWWRIPVEFKAVEEATGRNFLRASFKVV
jgi:lipopolysaccharide transport system ATP-binding protein